MKRNQCPVAVILGALLIRVHLKEETLCILYTLDSVQSTPSVTCRSNRLRTLETLQMATIYLYP
jgi:hypothetical protein